MSSRAAISKSWKEIELQSVAIGGLDGRWTRDTHSSSFA